jgi:hypothetical protein
MIRRLLGRQTEEDIRRDIEKAVRRRDVATVRRILERNPTLDTNMGFMGNGLSSLLHIAVRIGSVDIINAILDHPQTNINATHAFDYSTAIFHAPNIEILNLLLERGASISQFMRSENYEYGNENILMSSAFKRRFEYVQRLLEVPGIDPNAENAYGYTALWFAIQPPRGPVLSWEMPGAEADRLRTINVLLEDRRVEITGRVVRAAAALLESENESNKAVGRLILERVQPQAQAQPELEERGIPSNAENALSYNPIADGERMVNFHGESVHGRYYTKTSYNQIVPGRNGRKRNPYTKEPIEESEVQLYRARIEGGGKTRRRRLRRRQTRKRRRIV